MAGPGLVLSGPLTGGGEVVHPVNSPHHTVGANPSAGPALSLPKGSGQALVFALGGRGQGEHEVRPYGFSYVPEAPLTTG